MKKFFPVLAAFLCMLLLIPAASFAAQKKKTKKNSNEEFYRTKIVEKVKIIYGTDDLDDILYRLEKQIRDDADSSKDVQNDDDDDSKTSNPVNNIVEQISEQTCGEMSVMAVDAFEMFMKGESNESVTAKINEKYVKPGSIFATPMAAELLPKMIAMVENLAIKEKESNAQKKSEGNKDDDFINTSEILKVVFKSTCKEGVRQAFDQLGK